MKLNTASSFPTPLFLIAVFIAALALAILIYLLWRQRRAVSAFFGFAYDPEQDIFYSTLNPWQRKYGYCRLYDEAAALLSMIVDCEPIRFEYDGKLWLIELWKGQYGATSGCEIGVYTARKKSIRLFGNVLYRRTDDLFDISVCLLKNGSVLLSRAEKHWWLTGFKLGEFSEPGELTAIIDIHLKNEEMQKVFVAALQRTGYTSGEYSATGGDIRINFTTPHASQPSTRTPEFEQKVQANNHFYCEVIRALQEELGLTNGAEIMAALQTRNRALHKKLLRLMHPRTHTFIRILPQLFAAQKPLQREAD